MTAEIVNLKAYRKARLKADKNRKSVENRARFGREKAEQRRQEYERARIEAQHEANRLDDADPVALEDDSSADK